MSDTALCSRCKHQAKKLVGLVCYPCYAFGVRNQPWDTGMDELDRRTVRLLVLAVCDVFAVNWTEIRAVNKPLYLAETRRWLMYLLIQDGDFHRFQVCRVLNRHFSTVTHNLHASARAEQADKWQFDETLHLLRQAYYRLNREDETHLESGDWITTPLFGEPTDQKAARLYAFESSHDRR